MAHRLVLVVAVVAVAGCATLTPGTNLADVTGPDSNSLPFPTSVLQARAISLATQVEFDYQCARDRVRVIRSSEDGLTVDLDVCSVVRRYTGFSHRASWGIVQEYVSWREVTSLYPASALPPPLPPQAPPNQRAPPPATAE